MTKFEHLQEEIISLSIANNWHDAIQEWEIASMEISDSYHTCICTHYPINELCTLFNLENQNEAIVGNRCVEHFMGMETEIYFKVLRTLSKDINNSVPKKSLRRLLEEKIINQWEYEFCLNTHGRRNLSEAQEHKKALINFKILTTFQKSRKS